MSRRYFVESVVLEGEQAIFAPSEFGYSLTTTIGEELVQQLEEEREEITTWLLHRFAINEPNDFPRTKQPPWKKIEDGKYKIKFSWDYPETKEVRPGRTKYYWNEKPKIVDTDCVEITDTELPLVSGCKVRIAFYQRGWTLKESENIMGTSLKLVGVQVVSLNEEPSSSPPTMLELFGKVDGYKIG